jgi:hypothetical protein
MTMKNSERLLAFWGPTREPPRGEWDREYIAVFNPPISTGRRIEITQEMIEDSRIAIPDGELRYDAKNQRWNVMTSNGWAWFE